MPAAPTLNQYLLNKYNKNGPRYTSYPTALEFKESYRENDFINAMDLTSTQKLSLYIHIPFCHKLCYYCGCNKIVTRHNAKADEYIDYLEREIDLRSQQFSKRSISHIHLGGGTPTFLTENQMQRLIDKLNLAFTIDANVEMSIEIDPRGVSLEQLDHLFSLGFSRMSIGVQDFNFEVQQAINRVQDEQHIRTLIKHCRKLGVSTINLDLVYGLPKQTQSNFLSTLSKVIDIDPDRISLFSYAHLPTRFASQRKINDHDLPDVQTKLALQQSANSALHLAGYQHIGMDHFAKPEDELSIAQREGKLHRNFQGYTTGKDLDVLGLGVSSISQVGHSFAQNHKVLVRYYQAISSQGNAVTKGINISRDDCIRGHVINRLLCNFQLSITEIESTYMINFSDYFAAELIQAQRMAEDDLLILSNNRLKVLPLGRPLIRSICMLFDNYQSINTQKQFSRII